MKLKEIVELTYTQKLSEIAKGLPLGEKKLRGILKDIGCQPNGVGKSGWSFKGDDAEVLEKDVTEFAPHTATNKTNASNSTSKKESKSTIKHNSNDDTINDVNKTIKKDDDMIAEIKALIKPKSKDDDARIYKGIYFDKDIAHFLDNVQHGNKSEIVNKVLRQFLEENGLL